MKIIELEFRNEYSNYLYKIFEGINFSNYYFEVLEDDIINNIDGNIKSNLFDKRIIDYKTFIEVTQNNSYYILFTTIKAYRKEVATDKIIQRNCSDVAKSNCDVMIICYDCCYVYVFIINEKLTERIMHNCQIIYPKAKIITLEEMNGFYFQCSPN